MPEISGVPPKIDQAQLGQSNVQVGYLKLRKIF